MVRFHHIGHHHHHHHGHHHHGHHHHGHHHHGHLHNGHHHHGHLHNGLLHHHVRHQRGYHRQGPHLPLNSHHLRATNATDSMLLLLNAAVLCFAGLPLLLLDAGFLMFFFILDGTGHIAGIVLMAVGALGLVLSPVTVTVLSQLKDRHIVSHFQF